MSHWTFHDGWRAQADDAAGMRSLGAEIGALLRAGDLVVLDGPLGAGKTTLVQGLAEGLGVRGPITSPTFVIARRHPGPRVTLVHVDAYRVGSRLEIDDLDLDADVDQCVTVVEWGVGKIEALTESRLHVTIDRAAGAGENGSDGDPADGPRTVVVHGMGHRWAGLVLPAQ
jgi:tRNA threonylcarbamoyladenosine biosynthesis protein TsaE